MGERFTLPDGRELRRLENTHQRSLMIIFGEFSLDRAVYGTREGQAIEAVPSTPGCNCRKASSATCCKPVAPYRKSAV